MKPAQTTTSTHYFACETMATHSSRHFRRGLRPQVNMSRCNTRCTFEMARDSCNQYGNVFRHHSDPEKLFSRTGIPEILWTTIRNILYNSQSNGGVERLNHIIKQSLGAQPKEGKISRTQNQQFCEVRWSSGRASEFSVKGTGVQNHLLPFRNLGNFVHLTLLLSFGRDTNSRWSLLPGIYVNGSKDPTQGVNV